MFRVFTLAYSTMTIRVLDLHSLCAIARWIIAERQAEDGHFLEKGPVIMTSMQVRLNPPDWAVQTKPRPLYSDRGISGPCPVFR